MSNEEYGYLDWREAIESEREKRLSPEDRFVEFSVHGILGFIRSGMGALAAEAERRARTNAALFAVKEMERQGIVVNETVRKGIVDAVLNSRVDDYTQRTINNRGGLAGGGHSGDDNDSQDTGISTGSFPGHGSDADAEENAPGRQNPPDRNPPENAPNHPSRTGSLGGDSGRDGGGGSDQSGGTDAAPATRGGDAGDGTRGGGGDNNGRAGAGRGGGNNCGCGRIPIILDLDGDGVELVSPDESSAFYDIHANGYRYNLGWAGSDDGLLAYDKNLDGDIRERDEIAFADYVRGARTDLEGLRYFDSDGDGLLDGNDAEFGKFRVWQDLDQDGETDAGELRTLAEAGIESIDLDYAPGDDGIAEEVAGNTVFGIGHYTKTDGSLGEFGDVEFAGGAIGVREEANGDYSFRLADGEILKLAFAEYDDDADAGTDGLTIDFAAQSHTQYIGAFGGSRSDTFDGGGVARGLLLVGGGGDDALTGGDGDDWLVGGEGRDALAGGGGHDILFIDGEDAAVDGGEGFDVAFVGGGFGIALNLADGNLESVFGGGGDDAFSTTGAHEIIASGGDGADTLTGGEGADLLSGDAGADIVRGGDGDDVLIGGGDADTIDGGEGHDYIIADSADTIDGGEGWDTVVFTDAVDLNIDLESLNVEAVYGGGGDDYIYIGVNVASYDLVLDGGGGGDTLQGGVAKDWLHGGEGDDTLRGGYRDDSYVFLRGGGRDIISDFMVVSGKEHNAGEDDALLLGDGITAGDLVFRYRGTDLEIGIKGADYAGGALATDSDFDRLADRVTIKDWNNDHRRIENLRFGDGSAFDLEALISEYGPSNGIMDLGAEMRRLAPAAPADARIVRGTSGGDTLSAWGGDDVLYGRGGDDIYFLGYGSGRDTVDESHDNAGGDDGDVIRLQAGIDTSRVRLIGDGTNLYVELLDGDGMMSDWLKIAGHYAGENRRIERVETADGATLFDADDFEAVRQPIRGSGESETLDGLADFGDVFDSDGGGDDVLRGRSGDDVYYLGSGTGRDTIEEGYENAEGDDGDVIRLKAGDAAGGVQLVRDADNLYVLLLDGEGAMSGSLKVARYYADASYRIERIEDAAGATLFDGDDFAGLDRTIRGGAGADTLYGLAGVADVFDADAPACLILTSPKFRFGALNATSPDISPNCPTKSARRSGD